MPSHLSVLVRGHVFIADPIRDGEIVDRETLKIMLRKIKKEAQLMPEGKLE